MNWKCNGNESKSPYILSIWKVREKFQNNEEYIKYKLVSSETEPIL